MATDIVERKVTDGVMDKEAVIAQNKELVGLTIVEFMPRTGIRIKQIAV